MGAGHRQRAGAIRTLVAPRDRPCRSDRKEPESLPSGAPPLVVDPGHRLSCCPQSLGTQSSHRSFYILLDWFLRACGLHAFFCYSFAIYPTGFQIVPMDFFFFFHFVLDRDLCLCANPPDVVLFCRGRRYFALRGTNSLPLYIYSAASCES